MGAAALIPLAAEGIKLGLAASQENKARKYSRAKRPFQNYPIPQPIIDNVAAARNNAGVTGLPGQGHLEDVMRGGQASADFNIVNSQASPGAIAAGITATDKSFNNSVADLGNRAANYRDGQQRVLAGANMDLARAMTNKYNQDWEWNDKLPYLQNMAAASALKEAAIRNSMNALDGIAKIGMSAAGDKKNNDYWQGDPDGTEYNPNDTTEPIV